MDTKSKSDYSVVWSILAILIALASIGYCFSVIQVVIESSWARSTQLISLIVRIVEGGIG